MILTTLNAQRSIHSIRRPKAACSGLTLSEQSESNGSMLSGCNNAAITNTFNHLSLIIYQFTLIYHLAFVIVATIFGSVCKMFNVNCLRRRRLMALRNAFGDLASDESLKKVNLLLQVMVSLAFRSVAAADYPIRKLTVTN